MSPAEALVSFFTNAVDLPDCPVYVPVGRIWWEMRDGWRYPWRVSGRVNGRAEGYPCGEPVK